MNVSNKDNCIRIASINTKGGTGKTVCAQQIMTAYLYDKIKAPVMFFEYDLENQDSKSSLNQSKIVTAHSLKTREELRHLVDSLDENPFTVVDIGGNKSASYMLDELIATGELDTFTLIVIPLTDGDQDSLNALDVYIKIRKHSKVKIIFALNKVDPNWSIEVQFMSFLGDNFGYLGYKKGYIEHVDPADRNLIAIPNSEAIKISRCFGRTVYELALNAKADISHAEEQAQIALANNDLPEKIKWKKRKRLTLLCVEFVENSLKDIFKSIDEVLALK